MALKTAEEVKREFRENGIEIASWAKERGLSVAVVYSVLTGRRRGYRGQTHRAMVLLGLKSKAAGELVSLPEGVK